MFLFGIDFSYRFSFQLDAVRAMNDTVTDGIGNRRVPNELMPGADRNLRDDDRGSPPEPVLQDFQQTEPAGGIEGFQAQIVQDEKILFLDPLQLLQIASLSPGQLQLLEQLRTGIIAGLEEVQASLMA